MKTILLTIDEAAEVIGIGRKKLRELTLEEDFPFVKIGVKRMIIMTEISNWLSEHRGEEL